CTFPYAVQTATMWAGVPHDILNARAAFAPFSWAEYHSFVFGATLMSQPPAVRAACIECADKLFTGIFLPELAKKGAATADAKTKAGKDKELSKWPLYEKLKQSAEYKAWDGTKSLFTENDQLPKRVKAYALPFLLL